MPTPPQDAVAFEHPAIPKLGDVVFRPAEADGMPVMVMPLGQGTAALPLRSLQAELGIEDVSPDGRMFALIARALDYVSELRPGDGLPVEVLGGEASWQPDPMHHKMALARLRLRLVAQHEAEAGDWLGAERQALLAAVDEPGFPMRLQVAMVQAAAALGLPDAAAVSRLVEAAAHEMAFVEALRERLLRRVQRMTERVDALLPGLSQNLSGIELITRVRRLAGIAQGRIRGRFDELDGCLGALPEGLRRLDGCREAIRAHRDWLYSSWRAWNGLLTAWEAASREWAEGTWPLLTRTYRFLAARFMPVQEWQSIHRARRPDARRPRMVW